MNIPAVSGIAPAGYLNALTGTAGATAATAPVPGSGFGTTLAGSIDQLQGLQASSDALAVKAVTGNLSDIHDYTIAASQASVAIELTAALRNKAVEAFSEIMRMQA